MSLISYLFPRVIAQYSTNYNRDIRVLEEKGKYKLLVDGSRQSGEYILKLWQEALCTFGIIPSPDIRSILLLGVGGGTLIHLLHALYPDALISGVDVDARMIDIGKKYFGLGKVGGLTLTVADAKEFLLGAVAAKKQWDMVVVDLFVGAAIPAFVGEERFIRDLKRIMAPKGILLINYLHEREYRALAALLLCKLKKIFRSVRDCEVYNNRFFMVK
jgi:spermidine synthase